MFESLSRHHEHYKFRARPQHKSTKKPYNSSILLNRPPVRLFHPTPFKLIALFFFFAVAIVQPSEARPQALLKPDCADQVVGQAPHPSPAAVLPGTGHTPAAAQPTECLTPLLGMMSCMDYLTNLTVLTPPSACCDGLKSVISDAPVCLCHGMNGDMNSFMPRPIDPVRMMILPLTCGNMLPLQTIFSCNTLTVPPIMPPVPSVPTTVSP